MKNNLQLKASYGSSPPCICNWLSAGLYVVVKSPLFSEKEPSIKSPIHFEKSPTYFVCDWLYAGLYVFVKSPIYFEKEPYIKSPIYFEKSPTNFACNWLYVGSLCSCTYSAVVHILNRAKVPHISKEPRTLKRAHRNREGFMRCMCIYAKQPNTHSKEPYIHSIYTQKSPAYFRKSPIYFEKNILKKSASWCRNDLYVCRALSTKFVGLFWVYII